MNDYKKSWPGKTDEQIIFALTNEVKSKTEEIHRLIALTRYHTRIHIQIGFGGHRRFIQKDFDLPFMPGPEIALDLDGIRIPELSMDFVDMKYSVKFNRVDIWYSYAVHMDHCPDILREVFDTYEGWEHYGDSPEEIIDALKHAQHT